MSASPVFIPSSDGVSIAVHDLGGPDDPTATVLLFSHATGLHGLVWSPVAAALTDRFRCLALDYRGHGLSEAPVGASLAWSGMAHDAQAVLESDLVAGHRVVHGIGHSMGGAALVLAAARPSTHLGSLWLYEPVIVGPGVLPLSDAPNPLADGAARRRASFASYDEALANFAAKPPLNQLRPDALEAYVRGGFGPEDGRVTLRCSPATEAAVFRGAGESGAWDVLPALDLPVAIVAGRSQGEGPVAALAPPAYERLVRGTLVARPHLGHFGPLEDPSGTARDIADWVESNT
jgi:pimeloyl-ACP methyl ester carboxylesterase